MHALPFAAHFRQFGSHARKNGAIVADQLQDFAHHSRLVDEVALDHVDAPRQVVELVPCHVARHQAFGSALAAAAYGRAHRVPLDARQPRFNAAETRLHAFEAR